ncbi:uncharacterized protein LOC142614975 isoform X2 [Castanea sativa]|uniref:uncharacterized protein LOC142614975 isoform X2 n=1 Tax=Castanea sativa TaxID=21020 RepID=UPI003F64C8AD
MGERPGERNRGRGRVRDISSQYHLRTLTTKILASLNRRCTVTELRPPELQAHRKKPLGHTSATQIVEIGSGFFCRNSMHHIELRHTETACISVTGMRAAYGNVKNVIDRCDEA